MKALKDQEQEVKNLERNWLVERERETMFQRKKNLAYTDMLKVSVHSKYISEVWIMHIHRKEGTSPQSVAVYCNRLPPNLSLMAFGQHLCARCV